MMYKVYFKFQDQKEIVSFDDWESERGAGQARFRTKEDAENFLIWLGYEKRNNGIFVNGSLWGFADIALDELQSTLRQINHAIGERLIESFNKEGK